MSGKGLSKWNLHKPGTNYDAHTQAKIDIYVFPHSNKAETFFIWLRCNKTCNGHVE